MTQKNPPSIDELEAMLRMREHLDDVFEAYILRASEAELDELLLASGIDPATAQDRVIASIREAALRLDEPTPSAALEGLQDNLVTEPASFEDNQIPQRKPKTILRGLNDLATTQIRTVPFKPNAAEKQNAPAARGPAIGKGKAQPPSNKRARQNELVLGFQKKGSQQHGQPGTDDNFLNDDNFIRDVEINGRQFSAYRDRTPAGEVLLVGDFDQAWTHLEAGESRWPLRPTERDNARRCEGLGKSLFKRLLAAHDSSETRLQLGSSSHD